MKNKKHFNPEHFSKELKAKFRFLTVGETFDKDGKRFQYVGKDDNGNIDAIFLQPSDTNIPHLIGIKIKQARVNKGWNQTQLSNAANVRVASISEVEAGKANVQINTLAQIFLALDCYFDLALTPVNRETE